MVSACYGHPIRPDLQISIAKLPYACRETVIFQRSEILCLQAEKEVDSNRLDFCRRIYTLFQLQSSVSVACPLDCELLSATSLVSP